MKTNAQADGCEAREDYTLAELAKAAYLSDSDILSLERRGVIKSWRARSGKRYYAHAEVARLLGEENQ